MSSSCLWQPIFQWPQPRQLKLGIFETLWCYTNVRIFLCSTLERHIWPCPRRRETCWCCWIPQHILRQPVSRGMHPAIFCGSQSRYSQGETKLKAPCQFVMSPTKITIWIMDLRKSSPKKDASGIPGIPCIVHPISDTPNSHCQLVISQKIHISFFASSMKYTLQ